MQKTNKKPWLKSYVIISSVLFVAAGIIIYLFFTEKFEDTQKQSAAFSISADELLKEFQTNESAANRKYIEKIILVNGTIAETEAVDSAINIKMKDTLTGSYIIFAFQDQHIKDAKQLKEGDNVSIKGSCSGGIYSKILETEFISFKRCALNK